MRSTKVILFVLAILLCSCAEAYSECRTTGFSEEPVCEVSFFKLISDSKSYDGKLIELSGYYSVHLVEGKSKRFLFISKEAEFSADYGASVELGGLSKEIPAERRPIFEQILNRPELPLRIIGRLRLEQNKLQNGRKVLGVIEPLVGVSHVVPPPKKG